MRALGVFIISLSFTTLSTFFPSIFAEGYLTWGLYSRLVPVCNTLQSDFTLHIVLVYFGAQSRTFLAFQTAGQTSWKSLALGLRGDRIYQDSARFVEIRVNDEVGYLDSISRFVCKIFSWINNYCEHWWKSAVIFEKVNQRILSFCLCNFWALNFLFSSVRKALSIIALFWNQFWFNKCGQFLVLFLVFQWIWFETRIYRWKRIQIRYMHCLTKQS